MRNPYPLTRIGETVQKLEGFQYVSALDSNMGYYTIKLSPAIQGMIPYLGYLITREGIKPDPKKV